MAKNDLIGGSLWEQYSEKVTERMDNPTYMGELTEKDAEAKGGKLIVADYGADACGDAVRLFWIVDQDDTILDARFKSFGCGTAIASSDVMAQMCIGKTVDQAVEITNIDVEQALRDDPDTPAVPPQKMHCSVMAYDVIKKAAGQYKGVDMDAFEKEDMVCPCARVTLGTIQDVIKINDLRTVEQITAYTKAGAFCKSCVRPGGHEKRKYYLENILAETRAGMEREAVKTKAAVSDFPSMSLIGKHKAVESVLDQKIRPMLLSDGGSVEVEDIRQEAETTRIFITYGGACASCPSGQTGTLSTISDVLNQELKAKIEVVPL